MAEPATKRRARGDRPTCQDGSGTVPANALATGIPSEGRDKHMAKKAAKGGKKKGGKKR